MCVSEYLPLARQLLSPNKRCARKIQFKFHNNSLIINYDLSAAALIEGRKKVEENNGCDAGDGEAVDGGDGLIAMPVPISPFEIYHALFFVCVRAFFPAIENIEMKFTAF